MKNEADEKRKRLNASADKQATKRGDKNEATALATPPHINNVGGKSGPPARCVGKRTTSLSHIHSQFRKPLGTLLSALIFLKRLIFEFIIIITVYPSE